MKEPMEPMGPMGPMEPMGPMGGMDMGGMQMTFKWSVTETILFDGWRTTNYPEFLAACLAVVCMSVAMRICKSFITDPNGPFFRKMTRADEASLVLMYGVVAALSYLLMLIAMTYNAGLFLAVIFGQMAGFWLVEIDARPQLDEDGRIPPCCEAHD